MQFLFLIKIVVSAKNQCWMERRNKEGRMGERKGWGRREGGIARKEEKRKIRVSYTYNSFV